MKHEFWSCDRCGSDMKPGVGRNSPYGLGALSYTSGYGSANMRNPKDLCETCQKSFLTWLRNPELRNDQ